MIRVYVKNFTTLFFKFVKNNPIYHMLVNKFYCKSAVIKSTVFTTKQVKQGKMSTLSDFSMCQLLPGYVKYVSG